jgi:hypothetical protein
MINDIASDTVVPIDNQNNMGHSVDKMQGLKSIWQMLLEWTAKPNYCGSRLHNSGLHGLHTVQVERKMCKDWFNIQTRKKFTHRMIEKYVA